MTEPDGGFEFRARLGDVLRLGGFLVSPAEIEDTVQAAPGIAGAQVVAVASAAGTRAVAFVTLEPGAALDEAALTQHCAARFMAELHDVVADPQKRSQALGRIDGSQRSL